MKSLFLIAVLILGITRTLGAVSAVPTFHSLGLYWSDSGGSAAIACDVRYRKAGTTAWRTGYPLWFDARAVGEGTDAARPANEYRGSLVHLAPGTRYEIELILRGTKTTTKLEAATWGETFPIAKTIELPATSDQTLVITESGSPAGYVLYTPKAGATATIDVAGAQPYDVQIKASHVIVRGLKLARAGRDAIRIEDGLHDIVIEECDISGWGRIDTDAGALGPSSAVWGMYGDAGIYSNSKNLTRVVVQRNRIHDPRSDTNNWSERREKYNTFHPRGPCGIYLIDTAGHLVIRYNTIGGDDDHRFNDVVAGDNNFSFRGFPNRDSDIYGNRLSHAWDDGIEAEGGDCNVRIWGNYLTHCYTGIATAACSIGPIYIWRNVYDVSAKSDAPNDTVEHGPFAKLGDHPRFGGGRRYIFHNTLLQQPPPEGSTRTQGAGGALSGGTTERPMVDLVSRNNLWHLQRPDRTPYSSGHPDTRDNNFDYDLHSGARPRLAGSNNVFGAHMITGTPEYAPGHGAASKDGGRYALAADSPGYDAGEILPNFNDGFTGAGPDLGAHEAGTPRMEFGVDAYRKPAVKQSTHTYKRVGDLEIKADVHRLDDDKVRPVVVWIHGGALITGGRQRISTQLQQLVKDGAVVVSIDYRLAPETRLPAIIEDLEDAFKWVRARGPELFLADPDRIGVWGGSAGGYLTLTAGFRVTPRPQVLVSLYGYGDLLGDWYRKPSLHARHQTPKMSEAEVRSQVSGPPVTNAGERKGNGGAFYQFCRQRGIWPEEVSGWNPAVDAKRFDPYLPIKNVSSQYPPTMLIHGSADTDVPFDESVMMAEAFKKHGVPHTLITLVNGEHGFDGANPAAIDQAHQEAIAFTKKHLGLP